MTHVAATFKALGDPTRLAIVARLSQGAYFTAGTVSEGLGLTRQGVRKHLQVLADAKLISLQPKGREVSVSLEPAALESARSFIGELEHTWDKRLDALREFVEEK